MGKLWTEEDIAKALEEVEKKTASVRAAAKKYGMTEGTLRHRIKMKNENKVLVGAGRPPAFDKNVEKELTECIATMCKLGFSPNRSQLKDIVQSYVTSNNIKTPFTNNRPGKDWVRDFMSRNKLSGKKANIISSARKSATSNPFLIYDFYEVIDRIITEKNLGPSQIWNVDETGFPMDPQKSRVIAPIGETGFTTTGGSGRENTTVLGVCNAAGRVLDPLIIFQGKKLQSTWRGNNALPKTFYGVSDNGWMTTSIFSDWFKEFVKEVTERHLLIMWDGHLSHVSIDLIKLANKEDITLVKFPPHVTDQLQPLDVTCFGPIKRKWESLLHDWLVEWGSRLTKANFVNLVCKVWHDGLKPSNVISGFRTTGIYPVDREKYKKSRIDPRSVKQLLSSLQ